MTSRLIYIASPLGSDRTKWASRVALSVEVGRQIAELHSRAIPFSPVAHGVMWDKFSSHSYAWWVSHGISMVEHSDAVYRVKGVSPGADKEVARAHKLGIPVFRDMAVLREWLQTVAG